MKRFSGLLRQLDVQLGQDLPASAGFRQFSLAVPESLANALLEWLAAQPQFPQLYWQHRDGLEEAAICGAVHQFEQLLQAQTLVQQHNSARIWGLNAFDDRAWLFLPRLELFRRPEGTQLTLNLYSDHSLQDDAQQAREWLRTLVTAQPIPALQVAIELIQHQPERSAWNDMLQQALTAIEQQQMEKVVLARSSLLMLKRPLFAPSLMAASRQANRDCYHFMMRFTADSAFLGSSPERLYRREGTNLLTEALAGTVANHADKSQATELANWLLHDSKNQHENLLVVDDICQRLQGGASAVDVLPPEVVRLRKVQHLRRCIEGQLNSRDDADCLRRLQPTAAVAGLPRQAARDFILSHEPFQRGWYAGSVGYLCAQQAEFCVALRSSQIDGNVLQLYAGAGIVAGSDAEQEWQEIENKAAGLRTLLEP